MSERMVESDRKLVCHIPRAQRRPRTGRWHRFCTDEAELMRMTTWTWG